MIALYLLGWHAIADYPLQGDFLAKAKNHTAPIPGIDWWIALLNHSAIHAVGVAFITGSVPLACAEFVLHSVTDWLKCDGRISFRVDQAVHVGCKLIWALMVTR